jgi:hypothetical protein
MALRTSFRFIHAVWLGDARMSSASDAGDVSGDTGGEWDDGGADDARGDRALPVVDGVFDLGFNSLRICFILDSGR